MQLPVNTCMALWLARCRLLQCEVGNCLRNGELLCNLTLSKTRCDAIGRRFMRLRCNVQGQQEPHARSALLLQSQTPKRCCRFRRFCYPASGLLAAAFAEIAVANRNQSETLVSSSKQVDSALATSCVCDCMLHGKGDYKRISGEMGEATARKAVAEVDRRLSDVPHHSD